MATPTSLPLFHLFGDPPEDQAFDFIHVETIASRASIHDGTIRAHRHGNLFQILLIERGGGEMTFEAATRPFTAPCAILLPPATAHGFRFNPAVTDGWVISFMQDTAQAFGDRSGEALARLKALAAEPVVPLSGVDQQQRLSSLAAALHEERFLARAGWRIAMRGLLALIAVDVARIAAGRARGEADPGAGPSAVADATVGALRQLIEDNFRREHQLAFYADKLSMTVDRLNDHLKRTIGVTAGRLIRQRVLTEARRQLVFTSLTIQEIASDLAFSDASHFARFFRAHTGIAPHEFRAAKGG